MASDIPEHVFKIPPYSTMEWFCCRQRAIQDANMPKDASPYKVLQIAMEAYLQCHREMEDWIKANNLDHCKRYDEIWVELQKRKDP